MLTWILAVKGSFVPAFYLGTGDRVGGSEYAGGNRGSETKASSLSSEWPVIRDQSPKAVTHFVALAGGNGNWLISWPRLLAYPKETVVAEKFQAIVKLGIANTRMKDFYDLETLSRTFAFEGKTLAQAIQNTFQERGTDLPMGGLPVAFTSEFYDDVSKKRQWTACCAKNRSYIEKAEFKAVMEAIRNFLALPVRTVQEGHSFTKTWKPGVPWR